MGFEKPLLDLIAQEGYTEPTPIQKQAVPIALSGRDLIGIAKTGSGKTAAFVWPMIVHIIDQREVEKGEGPIAIIAAPTRELAAQIYIEAKKFCRAYGIRVCSIIGGVGKGEQIMQLRSQPFEVIVCTPVRFYNADVILYFHLTCVLFSTGPSYRYDQSKSGKDEPCNVFSA